MNKYKKVIDQIREKGNGDKKAKEKEADAIAEVLCLSVDESPHMIAMEDGAAMLAALYTLCLDDDLDTRGAYLELRDRMVYLIYDLYDTMRDKYPVHDRPKSENKSEPDVLVALKRLRAISDEEDTQ